MNKWKFSQIFPLIFLWRDRFQKKAPKKLSHFKTYTRKAQLKNWWCRCLTWTIAFSSCCVWLNSLSYWFGLLHHFADEEGAFVSWHSHYLNSTILHVILSFLIPPCLILSWTVMVSGICVWFIKYFFEFFICTRR